MSNKFLDGYHKFREQYASGDNSLMQQLGEGQQPETMVIGCADSRVDPALILNAKPGDLFVLRNVGNIVPPADADYSVNSALEFAVCTLNVKQILILGHSKCGGMQARMGAELSHDDCIQPWVNNVKTDPAGYDDVDDFAKASLRNSYQNCLQYPWIKERVEAGSLAIDLWFFEIKTGKISAYNPENDAFQPLN